MEAIVDERLWPQFLEQSIVIKPYDLNSNPLIYFTFPKFTHSGRLLNFHVGDFSSIQIQNPLIHWIVEHFYALGCIFCYSPHRVTANTTIPFAGYVIGQTILVTVIVNNESDEMIKEMQVIMDVTKMIK